MDASPSSWIHIKHEKELLTAHLLKREQKCHTLSVMADEFWVYISEDHCGEMSRFSSVVEGGLVCRSPLKFQRTFMLMLSFYEFRWEQRARKWVMDSSHNRWGRTSHQEPRISSWAVNPSLCVWLSTIIGSGITGKRSAISPFSPSVCLQLDKGLFIHIFLYVLISMLFVKQPYVLFDLLRNTQIVDFTSISVKIYINIFFFFCQIPILSLLQKYIYS